MTSKHVEITSLCTVVPIDSHGNQRLLRLADISDDSQLISFSIDENYPKTFSNRDLIYWNGGSNDTGFTGVWKWWAEPNYNDEEKDYVSSTQISSANPIEIIVLKNIYHVEDLLTQLKEGIEMKMRTSRMMICFPKTYGSYSGVLCTKKDLDCNHNRTTLKKGTYTLPLYELSEEHIFYVQNRRFYDRLDIEETSQFEWTVPPSEIVKNEFLTRISWSNAKSLNIVKKDWQIFKDYITNMPSHSLYESIAEICHCSDETAKQQVNAFLNGIDSHINGNDIEDGVLKNLLARNKALYKRCVNTLQSDWEADHKDAIAAASKELEEICISVELKNKENEELQSKISAAKDERQQLEDCIEQLRTRGADVEAKVQDKILKARQDAAEFISEMAFVVPSASPTNMPVQTADPGDSKSPYTTGMALDEENLDSVESWKDEQENFKEELAEAGISKNHRATIAGFLYAAHVNQTPVLLAGLGGLSIAKAFSASLFGKMPGILDCSGDFVPSSLLSITQGTDDVIIIKNPFHANWIDHIPELLLGDSKNRQYFLWIPFAEDLLIEPPSVYNYMIPVITDYFLDAMPTENFQGGYRSSEFNLEYKPNHKRTNPEIKNDIEKCSNLFNSLNIPALGKNRIVNILNDYYYLTGKKNLDTTYPLTVIPYAYVTGQSDKIDEELLSQLDLDDTLCSDIRNLLGVES